MDRRNFIKNISIAGGTFAFSGNHGLSAMTHFNTLLPPEEPCFDKSMRLA